MKSAKQLLKDICKTLQKAQEELVKVSDEAEFHLEQEHVKKYEDWASIQFICEELEQVLDISVGVIEEDELNANVVKCLKEELL